MMLWTDKFGNGGPELLYTQTFAASGNWLKPADVLPWDKAVVELWGGGGAGSWPANGSYYNVDLDGEGGYGGTFVRLVIPVGLLKPSEPVLVGAGGLKRTVAYQSGSTYENRDRQGGGDGGASAFFGLKAPGGKGAKVQVDVNGVFWYSGEAPQLGDIGQNFVYGPTYTVSGFYLPRFVDFFELSSENATWAGATGGRRTPTATVPLAQGLSEYGGDGGLTVSNGAGQDGSSRGGGGGAGNYLQAGNGGRGEVVVSIWRGL